MIKAKIKYRNIRLFDLTVFCIWSIGFSLNSIYFQISIYTWQHTSIQIHGKGISKQVTLNLYKFFSKSVLLNSSRINAYDRNRVRYN